MDLDANGELRCRKCGGTRLRCKERERLLPRKHLVCSECGARQVFEEPPAATADSTG